MQKHIVKRGKGPHLGDKVVDWARRFARHPDAPLGAGAVLAEYLQVPAGATHAERRADSAVWQCLLEGEAPHRIPLRQGPRHPHPARNAERYAKIAGAEAVLVLANRGALTPIEEVEAAMEERIVAQGERRWRQRQMLLRSEDRKTMSPLLLGAIEKVAKCTASRVREFLPNSWQCCGDGGWEHLLPPGPHGCVAPPPEEHRAASCAACATESAVRRDALPFADEFVRANRIPCWASPATVEPSHTHAYNVLARSLREHAEQAGGDRKPRGYGGLFLLCVVQGSHSGQPVTPPASSGTASASAASVAAAVACAGLATQACL